MPSTQMRAGKVQRYDRQIDGFWISPDIVQFWKQFFEASANMSLNHELAAEEDETALDETQTTQGHDPYGTPSSAGADRSVTTGTHYEDDLEDTSLLDSPSFTVPKQGTPRRQPTSNRKEPRSGKKPGHKDATYADYPSPYETLKQEIEGKDSASKKPAPTTPGRRVDLGSTTPSSSSPFAMSTQKKQQNADPILHRMLDKTYRVHATPHTARKTTGRSTADQSTGAGRTKTSLPAWDSSPFSPQMQAPQLRSEIFGSPQRAPRTPGISVQKARALSGARDSFESGRKDPFSEAKHDEGVWDSSEVEDDLGISPPKTMQFVVPQSRLLQTPAREASKRIVEDLLYTAGGGEDTDDLNDAKYDDNDDIDLDLVDDSPSVVRKMGNIEESF